MSIPGLTIIGERINPGFASSKRLIETGDIAGLQALARDQAAQGAHYLTINVGQAAERDPAFMTAVIRAVQEVVALPLSIDSPDPVVQEACLKVYDPAKAAGRPPIMNSVAETRLEMLDLRRIQPCRVLFMVSERLEHGRAVANRSPEQIHDTALRLIARAREADPGLAIGDCIVDVSLTPLASDTENHTRMAIDAIRAIGSDPRLAGVHCCVGLSNLSIMLPKQAADGGPLKVRLENAFLSCTVPYGLDVILGSPGRTYRLLEEDDFVLQGFREAIAADGFDSLMRLRELYVA